MSELVVTLLRLSYLILLWVLVLLAIGVLRRDVFGTRVLRRGAPPKPAAAARPAQASKAAVVGKPGPPPRSSTGSPVGAAAAGAPSAPPGRSARLLVTDGALRGRSLPLGTSAAILGRSPTSTLVIDDDYASNRHARIFPQRGGWWVEDLGSTNGTYVDGKRIEEPVELTPGREVRIGQTVIELQR
jgi:hypothetical protein